MYSRLLTVGMPPETARPIDAGNVYRNTNDDPHVEYVVVDGFYVDEVGDTQVRTHQYSDTPIAAHNIVGDYTGVSSHLTVTVNDIRDRILKGELRFVTVDDEE